MNIENFTILLHDRLINACGRGEYGLMAHLQKPASRYDTERMQRIRTWITSLCDEDKEMVRLLMDQCAASCLFSIATLIDGVSGNMENTYVELRLVCNGKTIEVARSNEPGGTEWHHVVSSVIKRFSGVRNEGGDSKDNPQRDSLSSE